MPCRHRFPDAFIPALCVASFLTLNAFGQTAVKVWEESITIPTYGVGAPDPNPMFYTGRTYQGAKGPVYPYPLQDKLTGVKADKAYKAVYLENQYIKLCILPELGGRIFTGLDKTDNYNFFYQQHVIKPALIGMVGAWISGGVEWNIPHHHRASTFMTVDHTIEEHPDGSKTVWVGEVERRHRMKWIVGLTLRPDKSYVEATVKLFNRTPVANSFLYFSNVAVHANENYQVIFPPSTQFATQHAKHEFSEWPIARGAYGGVDFSKGVDVSWYKNHPSPTSMFAWNYEDDFLAGYDHGKEAGTVHVADHHVVPGKKFFTWGVGGEGKMWDQILTDDDGPYLELMVGGYSDNQPDYSWVQPYEVKTVHQIWYPIRAIGGVKNANAEAAVNLDVSAGGKAKFGFNTTKAYEGAKVALRAGQKVLFERETAIGPDKPFVATVDLPAGAKAEDLTASLSAGGRELIRYSPVKLEKKAPPKPVEPPPPPKDIKTNEELYLAGLRLEQFYNPALEPYPYYEEALRRDPGDYRVNTALGILYCKRGMYREAEEKFRTAIERATRNYTSPKDGEAYYYLGVSLQAQGKLDAAYDAFFKASWSHAWQDSSYYGLAQIAAGRGDYDHALDLANTSLAANSANAASLNLKTVLLRKLARNADAERVALQALEDDPLNFQAGYELSLIRSQSGDHEVARQRKEKLVELMHGDVQSYHEIAVEYGNAGLWDDAIAMLNMAVETYSDRSRVNPMLYYFLADYSAKKGAADHATKYYELAAKVPSNYCFPYRLEAIGVLERAMARNPRDARAPYYLGNLLYDLQPERAITAWETARILDPGFAPAHRNLGLAYAKVKNDLPAATASLEKAISLDKNNAMVYFDLDDVYERAGVSPAKRLALMEANQSAISQRDDTLAREVDLYVQTAQYDKAIGILSGYHFHLWEGAVRFTPHKPYLEAHILRGNEHYKASRYQEALRDYQAALEYPENLEEGKPYRDPDSVRTYYLIGKAQQALKDQAAAKASFERAIAEARVNRHSSHPSLSDWSSVYYYEGLALWELDRKGDASAIFARMVEAGQQSLNGAQSTSYFAKFGERQSEQERLAMANYVLGCGYLGQRQNADAKRAFEQTLKLQPNHLWAKWELTALK